MRLTVGVNRALKTGLAATLALVAYRTLQLPHGYWAVISAILVMQANLGRSITASSSRLIGTAIGAAVGTAIFWAAGPAAWGLFLAVALTIWICNVTHFERGQRLAGITAALVMLVVERSAWQTGLNRFVDVALGVLIALAVSVVWPSRAAHALRLSLAETYGDLQKFSALAVAAMGKAHDAAAADSARAGLRMRLRRNYDLVADLEREPGDTDRLLVSLQQTAERVRDHVLAIDYSARVMSQDGFHSTLGGSLQRLYGAVAEAFQAVEADLRDQSAPAAPPLTAALESLERDFSAVRETGATLAYSSDELLRFYALFYRLQQLVYELTRSLEFANALEHRG